MSIIVPWLIVAALIVTLIAIVDVAIKQRKEKATEINRLTSELEAQKRMSQELATYIKEVTKINGDQEDVAQKIEEAKNDEEVMAIIAGLVNTNNDRVRK